MNHPSRSFIITLFITITHFLPFFLKPVYSSDSLKVGLILQSIDQNDIDTLSNQFVQELFKNSELKVINLDTNYAISVTPFAIDSITLTALKQQHFQGLILCKFSTSDSVNKLIIEASVFDNLKPTKFEEVDLNQEDLSDRFLSMVREMEIFFQHQQKSENTIRIIFAPLYHSTLDSFTLSFHQSLSDSLKKIVTSPLFSKFEFEILAIDSFYQSGWTDSALQKFGKSHQAHLIISGKIDKDEEQSVFYYPHLIILQQNNFGNALHADDKLLSGKTCQIRQFDLPTVSVKNFINLTDFMRGYFLIQEKKYSAAIEKLKKLQSHPGYFFLAESYFFRGMINEHDLPLAHADWDSSIFYWQKFLSQTDFRQDSVCIQNNIGLAFQLNGKLDSAMVYFKNANSNLTEIVDHQDFIKISHNLGNIYLINGQWKKALDIFQSTVQAMEQSNDSLSLAITYENLGHIYQLIFQKSKAISYYHKALELREKMHDEAGIANSFNFLGNVYQEKKDFQLAKDYFKQSLALNLKIHHEPQIANSYDKLGQVFQITGEQDSALIYFQKSYETFDMLDDKDGVVQTMLHQASVYQKQRISDKAISLYEKTLEIIGDNNSYSLRAQIYDRMGDIYNNQDNLIPALDYYQQSADLYEKAGNFETLSLILYNMGLIKLKQNDYVEGYELLKKAITLDEEHGFNYLSGEKDFLDHLESFLKKN